MEWIERIEVTPDDEECDTLGSSSSQIEYEDVKVVGYFSCKQICGGKLQCGHHSCPLPCHAGTCPPCQYDPSVTTTCPCGTTRLSAFRKHCLDPVPTCDAICGKLQETCGLHTCRQKCHNGKCPPCDEAMTIDCRCRLDKAITTCSHVYPPPPPPLPPSNSSSSSPSASSSSSSSSSSVSSSLNGEKENVGEKEGEERKEVGGGEGKKKKKKKKKKKVVEIKDGVFLCDKVCETMKSCGRHRWAVLRD